MDNTIVEIIELSQDDLKQLERVLQWPEDLAAWDKLNKTINGVELGLSI